MQLVIAEKPSVGVALAKALGVTDKKDGYIEGNGYIVSWCVGHLVSLANADMYMKCQYLDKITGGKGIVFATGTPVSNSNSRELFLGLPHC